MNKGKSIDQDGDIISGVVVSLFFHILVDDLTGVVVDVVLVNQVYVLALSCVPFENLYVVLLYLCCLCDNIIIPVCQILTEECSPLIVREGV